MLSLEEKKCSTEILNNLGGYPVERKQLLALHGEDVTGVFALLGVDGAGLVSRAAWTSFLLALKRARGGPRLSFFLAHLLLAQAHYGDVTAR